MNFTAVSDPRKIPKRSIILHEVGIDHDSRLLVANKANDLLGYKSSVLGVKVLAKALDDLSIEILDEAEVNLYKSSKVFVGMLSGTKKYIVCGINILLIICTVTIGMVWNIYYNHYNPVIHGLFVCLLVLCIIASLALLSFGGSEWWGEGNRIRSDWRQIDLSDYSRYIPVHILNYAILIKEKVPNCKFNISELQHTYEYVSKPDPDPFLYVTLGYETYCIGVWDEREFEAKM